MSEQSLKTKDILLLFMTTGFLAASVLMPGLPLALSPLLKNQKKQWGHFNRRKLRAEVKRLHKHGILEEGTHDGEMIFRLTEKGKEKVMKYKLEALSLTHKQWDGKWRLVIYDIPKGKKFQADAFRRLLKKMELLALQKSVYITPYPCKNEIAFLTTLYNIESSVDVLTITGIDHEEVYKRYFGL